VADLPKPKKAKGGPPRSFTEGMNEPGGSQTPGAKAKRAKAQNTDSNNK